MRIYNIKAVVATTVVATAMLIGLGSCKGRTMENMEPTGETIEVVIENPEDSVGMTEAVADTLSQDSPE